MERLPAVGEPVSLATELVVREDGWALYGFLDELGRRFFQRLIGVSGVGPKLAVSLVSALGVERGARAVQDRNIALLASVSGIGKKTAERLALELADKVGEFVDTAAAPVAGAADGDVETCPAPRSRRPKRCPTSAPPTRRSAPRGWTSSWARRRSRNRSRSRSTRRSSAVSLSTTPSSSGPPGSARRPSPC